MANLIICCDGTWNNPRQEDNGIPAPTNVVKLYHALAKKDGMGELKAYYHPGLGGEETGLKDSIVDGALEKALSVIFVVPITGWQITIAMVIRFIYLVLVAAHLQQEV